MKNLTLLLFFFSSFLYSHNYVEGYIITNDNDTIYGFIDFAPDELNCKRCLFKDNKNMEEYLFSPEDIKGYRIDLGKYYVSKKISLNEEIRYVFVEYLLQGKVNLYYYYNQITYFIFEKEDGTMQLITQKPERIEKNKIIPDLSYRNKVRRVLADCYPAIHEASKLKFTTKDMINITKLYHDNMCNPGEECIIFENKDADKTYFQIKYSLYLGIQQFKYTFEENRDFFKTKYAPVIGFQMNFIFPRWTKAFSVQTDLSFSKLKDDNRIFIGDYHGVIKHQIIDYKMYSLTGKLGGKYSLQISKCRPVIETGPLVTFLINPSCIIKEETFYPGTNSTHINSGLEYEMKKLFIGMYAGIGCDYIIREKHSLFFRVELDKYFKIDLHDNRNSSDNLKTMMKMKLGYNF